MLLNCGVGEDSESPLDCKEIQPVNPKGNQSWIFIEKTDVETETPILWPPDLKNWLIGKAPDARNDWRQEKGMTEDEMIVWHHWLNGHEFESTPKVSDGQGGLVCYSPWDYKELNTTEQLNWADIKTCHHVSRGSSPSLRWTGPILPDVVFLETLTKRASHIFNCCCQLPNTSFSTSW